MPRTRPPYPEAFRQQIVELARAGRSVSQLAEEFEPSGQTIRSWIKQADIDDGVRSDGSTSTERDELRRLRKENRRYPSRSATSWQSAGIPAVPPASLIGRPAKCRRDLRVHWRCDIARGEPGRISDRHHAGEC